MGKTQGKTRPSAVSERPMPIDSSGILSCGTRSNTPKVMPVETGAKSTFC